MIESDFEDRVVTSTFTGADNEIEESLRPRKIVDYIGQASTIAYFTVLPDLVKQRLQVS